MEDSIGRVFWTSTFLKIVSWTTWTQVSLTSTQFAEIDGESFLGQISIVFLLWSHKHMVVEPFKVDFLKNFFIVDILKLEFDRKARPPVVDESYE